MAHGSKRWIVAWDGRLKRSSDRTKKDHYAGLRQWEPFVERRRYSSGERHGDFCPQCKHNYKAVKAWNEAHYESARLAAAEWDAHFRLAIEAWKVARRRYLEALAEGLVAECPPNPRYRFSINGQRYWEFVQSRTVGFPILEERTYLCPRHRNAIDKKWEMWHAHLPGENARYQGVRLDEWRTYRSKVKAVLQQAKYDEDLYEDVPRHRRGWLD